VAYFVQMPLQLDEVARAGPQALAQVTISVRRLSKSAKPLPAGAAALVRRLAEMVNLPVTFAAPDWCHPASAVEVQVTKKNLPGG
jgi:hypothetical protein